MIRLLTAASTLTLAAAPLQAATKAEVVENYADIAEAGRADSLATAKTLQAAVNALIAAPSAEALANARRAWLASRVPYQQNEGSDSLDDLAAVFQ